MNGGMLCRVYPRAATRKTSAANYAKKCMSILGPTTGIASQYELVIFMIQAWRCQTLTLDNQVNQNLDVLMSNLILRFCWIGFIAQFWI